MGIPITIKMLDTGHEIGVTAKHTLSLTFEQQEISLAELITKRVITEVESFEKTRQQRNSLIDLDDKELALNSPSPAPRSTIDTRRAIAKALSGFRKSAYFVIVNGRQVTELDDVLELDDHMEVEFFRLTPLVGG